MVVTSVSVNVLTKTPRLRGTASIVLDDCFKVAEILILQRNPADEPFIVMPCKYFGKPNPQDGKQKRKNVAYPITQEFLAHIKAAVLEEYFRKLEMIKNGREAEGVREPERVENENQPVPDEPAEEKSPDQNVEIPSIDDDYKEED